MDNRFSMKKVMKVTLVAIVGYNIVTILVGSLPSIAGSLVFALIFSAAYGVYLKGREIYSNR